MLRDIFCLQQARLLFTVVSSIVINTRMWVEQISITSKDMKI